MPDASHRSSPILLPLILGLVVLLILAAAVVTAVWAASRGRVMPAPGLSVRIGDDDEESQVTDLEWTLHDPPRLEDIGWWQWGDVEDVDETVKFVEGPVRVTVHNSRDMTYAIEGYDLQAHRQSMTDDPLNFTVIFPSESLDEATARAAMLAQRWNLEPELLDEMWEWKAKLDAGRQTHEYGVGSRVAIISKAPNTPAGVAIKPSYDFTGENPWMVSLSFGFKGLATCDRPLPPHESLFEEEH